MTADRPSSRPPSDLRPQYLLEGLLTDHIPTGPPPTDAAPRPAQDQPRAASTWNRSDEDIRMESLQFLAELSRTA